MADRPFRRRTIAAGRLRIGVLAPPVLPVPPPSYAGTERVVDALVGELIARGHEVTLFAPGDSETEARLVPTVERSLWSSGFLGDASAFFDLTVATAWDRQDEFDVIHSHVESAGFLFARHARTPVLTTLHGRLDVLGFPDLLAAFTDIPLVAVSTSQARWFPDNNWVATIHHGLPLEAEPFSDEAGSYLAFVGRITPEKGIADAIEVARRSSLRLRIAAKVQNEAEQAHFEEVVAPAIKDGIAEYLGELGQPERDVVYAGALATLMLGPWPEPFGLVAIESMATGTPVVARRAGALTETVEHAVDGFLVDDVDEALLALSRVRTLDRRRIRDRALQRFSPGRMADEYEVAYRSLVGGGRGRDEDGAGAVHVHGSDRDVPAVPHLAATILEG